METAKYIAISNKIAEEIRSGAFRFGEKLYSRKDLMLKYHVGDVTANRIQNMLAKQNYVRKVKGSGIYVSYTPHQKSFAERLNEPHENKIDFLEIFRFKSGGYPPQVDFDGQFYDEINLCLKDTKLPYKYNMYTAMQVSDAMIPVLPIRETTGYLVTFGGSMTMFYAASIFLNPLLHNVVLDTYVPGSNGVLTDSTDGMERLVDHALDQGFLRFIVSRNYPSSLGEFYDRERFDAACRYIRTKGLPLQTLENGSFNDLIAMASAEKAPFCVMFMQDALALRFCHLTASLKLQKHLVTGFDDWPGVEKPDCPVATIAINYKAMVQAAFRLLLSPMALRKEIIRIPGIFRTEITNKKKRTS